MNKNHYKVIFSRALNQLIVVSELAKSQGKAASENIESGAIKTISNSAALFDAFLVCRLKPIHFSLMMPLGFVYLLPNDAQANPDMAIRADKAAPGNQQPTVLQTANGLPQVNIQTPSAAGVSRNQYSQFDVAEKGAVLNNARKATQTQLAGWVQGNPNLAAGEAKVILNEVNSANPSRLKGYVEVAGKKADVVIANPSGIHCEGCGVINAGRATLTTGKAQVENGELKGYEVKGGKVTVAGKGMDNTQSDYTDIIAEKAQLDGGVWAKKGLKVTTGKNKVDRTNDSVVYVGDKNTTEPHRTSSQTDSAQTYAVDVSQLGGMYAEKIHLIDNGSGLGVRNAGHIGASSGEVQIDSQGRIVNSGTVNAAQAVQFAGKKGIENRGKIENRQNDITLTTPANLQQSGSIVARSGNVQQTANQSIIQQGETIAKGHIHNQAATMKASETSLMAAGVTVNDAETGERRELEPASPKGKTLNINATHQVSLQGRHLASGKVNVEGATIDITKSDTLAYSIEMNASQGAIDANEARLVAHSDLSLKTPTQLQARNSALKAENISTQQHSLITQNATWEQTGITPFVINTAEPWQNQGGTLKTQGDFVVNVQGMENQQGRLIAKGRLTIDAGKHAIHSEQGELVSAQALTLTSGSLINDGGLIQSSQHIRLNTQDAHLSNQQTLTERQDKGIVALGELHIQSANMSNQQGRIVSGGNQHIQAQTLENSQGFLGTPQAFHGNMQSLQNSEGVIQAGTSMAVTLTHLAQQQGVLKAGGSLNLTANGDILSTENSQLLGQRVMISASGQFNQQQSYLLAQEGAVIRSGQFNNHKGHVIVSQGALDIHTNRQRIINTLGQFSAGANLTITSGEVDNRQGLIQSRQHLHLHTGQGNLNNQQTQAPHQGIVALGELALTTQHLLNQKGSLLSQQDQRIESASLRNEAGVVSSLASQTLTVTQGIENEQGRITSHSGKLRAQTIENALGVIQGVHQLNIQTEGAMNNQNGKIQAGDMLAIQTRELNNQKGQIRVTEGHLSLSSLENIDNTRGYLTAKQEALISANNLNNQQGVVYNAQGLLQLHLKQHLYNQQGEVIGKEKVRLNSTALFNQQGKIYAEKHSHLDVQARIDNQQYGKLYSLGESVINTNQVDNQGGEIRAQEALTLNATTYVNNQKVGEAGSFIESGDRLILNTAHLNNGHTKSVQHPMTQGVLASRLTLSAQSVDNLQGKIHSREQGDFFLQQTLDNRQGEITGGVMSLEGRALHIDNQAGRLQAENTLSIVADAVTTNGHLEGQNVSITQKQDFVTANSIHAARHLLIETVGNLVNQHSLYADERVTLKAHHLTNQVDGKISSETTELYAQGDLLNEGLINSISPRDAAKTLLHVTGRLTNLGKGRIYGDDVTLQGDIIENLDKAEAHGDVHAAVIAARGNLTLAAREIDNNTRHYLSDHQTGSTLFSGGDLQIGRRLNAANQLEGKAEVLRNHSSLIEAEGNVTLNVNHIHNHNRHFSVEHVKTGVAPNDITKLTSHSINETFIVPMGRDERGNLKNDYTNPLNGDKENVNLDNPYIDMKQLRWAC